VIAATSRTGLPLPETVDFSEARLLCDNDFERRSSRIDVVANSCCRSLNALGGFVTPEPLCLVQSAVGLRMSASVRSLATRFVDNLDSGGAGSCDVIPLGTHAVDSLSVEPSCAGHGDGPQRFLPSLRRLMADEDSDLGDLGYVGRPSTAVPVLADLVALPVCAGSVSLIDNLPGDIASVYASPETLLLQKGAVGSHKAPPRATIFGPRKQYVKLILRMQAIGMIAFTRTPKAVNGVFCTKKSDGRLRMILDARTANSMFVDSPHVDLPGPDTVSALEAGSGCPLGGTILRCRRCYLGKWVCQGSIGSGHVLPQCQWGSATRCIWRSICIHMLFTRGLCYAMAMQLVRLMIFL
jgi:hypothetical protein